ncbi:hypothetical protein P153DRAFT_391232 [Dothidotthia symphoricarpi CBS 119687]|uniref:Uncharacterized protein n=1 Tax=Dothidotthia symphoricarpi CBS 119687 TaxID=1392245 RepID=A0A6A5ZVN8_9PLEO|nr:uncharacterized protein P153DRAFT_391232 [Dothidotthia symphoricarpi CBS 119687]KAF2123802.1 hypothetical protein P153DRAFT_391232 [Dothidotthia symphoricarpi CBS 119687]
MAYVPPNTQNTLWLCSLAFTARFVAPIVQAPFGMEISVEFGTCAVGQEPHIKRTGHRASAWRAIVALKHQDDHKRAPLQSSRPSCPRLMQDRSRLLSSSSGLPHPRLAGFKPEHCLRR